MNKEEIEIYFEIINILEDILTGHNWRNSANLKKIEKIREKLKQELEHYGE